MAFPRLSTVLGVFLFSTITLLFYFHQSPSAVSSTASVNSPHRQPLNMQKLSKRIAIIGAGAGGASTAFHLRRFAPPGSTLNITIFDKNTYIGGRSTTVNVYDDPLQPVELGASIFVSVNTILVNASQELGLSLESTSDDRPSEAPDSLGVYNGEKFVFIQPRSGGKLTNWWNLARLLYKYGPISPWRTKKLMETTVGQFLGMYKEPIFPFSSLNDAVLEVGLLPATAATGEEFLNKNGINPPFSLDLIQASTRVNYGQNLGLIHGLEAMVCMAAEGAMAIEGGNWRIFKGMAENSKAEIKLSTAVTRIEKTTDRRWKLTSRKVSHLDGAEQRAVFSKQDPMQQDEEEEEEFDTVVLAAPYQYSELSVSPPLERTPDEIPYVTLHVTLFTSPKKLDPAFFNLPADTIVPETVLTTLNTEEQNDPKNRFSRGEGARAAGKAGFFSISGLRTILKGGNDKEGKGKEYLYKIFSPEEIDDAFLNKLLGVSEKTDQEKAVTWIYRHIWKSYPYLYPRVTFEESKLDWNLWYVSGIESFISTMETSALMGMNVARLVVDAWGVGGGGEEKAKL